MTEQVERLRAKVAQANARANNLQIALQTNRRIGAAIGIVMSQYNLTEAAALNALRTISQHSQRKLRDVAEDVLYTGTLNLNPSIHGTETTGDPTRPHLRVIH